ADLGQDLADSECVLRLEGPSKADPSKVDPSKAAQAGSACNHHQTRATSKARLRATARIKGRLRATASSSSSGLPLVARRAPAAMAHTAGVADPVHTACRLEADGKPLFVARAMYKGGLHPGKASQHLENGGCNIGYAHREVAVSEYQVLCGDASKLKWVKQEGALNIQGFVPVEAGHEESGEKLFIGKTLHEGSQQLGKCAPHIKKGMSFAYGHKERETKEYMVLAYAD
ncbi:hypothetical protein IWW55_001708, partial [Coemansia sp. RSA 2706]